MILLSSNQDFSAASGIINAGFLENIYHSVIDDAFVALGRTITLHLKPTIQEDISAQVQQQSNQFNPFFSRVPIPKSTTRNTGTKVTHRDIQYKAQIKIGPLKEGEDSTGMGDLKANECVITLPIESITYLPETLSISIEGRRYTIIETRPIGFSTRRYIMIKLSEINELDNSTAENDG